jgi:hypothetical protein
MRLFRVAGRFALRIAITAFVLQTTLLACPVCFQIEDDRTAAGVRAAVIVLMSVTGIVLAGCGVFIRRLVRRP